MDLRSSELKTWPFWRTRARGSAMVCGCVGVVVVVVAVGVWVSLVSYATCDCLDVVLVSSGL